MSRRIESVVSPTVDFVLLAGLIALAAAAIVVVL